VQDSRSPVVVTATDGRQGTRSIRGTTAESAGKPATRNTRRSPASTAMAAGTGRPSRPIWSTPLEDQRVAVDHHPAQVEDDPLERERRGPDPVESEGHRGHVARHQKLTHEGEGAHRGVDRTGLGHGGRRPLPELGLGEDAGALIESQEQQDQDDATNQPAPHGRTIPDRKLTVPSGG